MNRKITYTDPTKLDIGCKGCTKEGYTGIDKLDFGQDVLWDVRQGIPFANNSVTDIYCNNFLEHLADADMELFFTELYRICKNDANIEIVVPDSGSMGAYTHNHFSFWNELRFEGLIKGFENNWFTIEKMYKIPQRYYEELRVYLKVVK